MPTAELEDRLAVHGMSAAAAAITDAPASSVCVPCQLRGHVCFAQKIVREGQPPAPLSPGAQPVDGEAWCIFCLDDRICLHDQKLLPTKPKMKKAVETAVETEGVIMAVASSSNPEKPKKSSGNGHGNGNGHGHGNGRQPERRNSASEAASQRICGKPECSAVLGERNKSGFCQDHFHYSERPTHSERQNGHRKKSSEQKVPSTPSSELTWAPEKLKPDRLDHLFLSLPITEKVRIAGAWLTGKI